MIVLPYRLDLLCFTVFEHTDFRGESQRFCGDQEFTSSKWNKIISSLRVESEDCGLILYDRSHVGNFKWFSGEVASIGSDWNDKASSIQIRPWILHHHEGRIQPSTVFYEHNHHTGDSIAVKGTTEWIGDKMNDEVSSFQCEGECAVLVFEHINYKGESRLYDGSQNSITNFNDKLSSVLVLMESVCVTLYEHSRFRGRSFQRCSDTDAFPSEWNDRVSSLTVDCPHCSVILYQHISYKGDYKAYSGKVSYIGDHWNDEFSSLQIRPWKLENYARQTEQSCVDPGEKKAHNVIQWIPIISTLYNLGTSIYYGAVGCHKVAQERATDLALDVVMDLATVATGGAVGVAAYGVKAGVKGGVKVGLHAARKAITATVKNAVKKGLKSGAKIATRGITGNAKSLGKSLVKSTKNIANAVKTLPESLKQGAEAISRGASKVAQKGITKATKKGAAKLKNIVQRKIDDLADSARRQIDEAGTARKSGNANLCRQKRMIGAPGCKRNLKPEELPERHLDAQNRQLSEPRRSEAQNFFNEMKDSQKRIKQEMANGGEIDAIQFEIPGQDVTKNVLHKLAYYHEFMDDAMTGTGKSPLKVNMKIGGEPFEFVMTPSRDRQIYIGFTKKTNDLKHSYHEIAKKLDSDDPLEMQRNARVVLRAIDAPGGQTIDWEHMTLQQREAAKELITLTHVAEGAVPDATQVNNMLNTPMKTRTKPNSVQGGVGGIDKAARSYLQRIKEDPRQMSFQKAFNTENGEFIIARSGKVKVTPTGRNKQLPGGKAKLKSALYRPDSTDKDTRRILQQERDAMSDSSNDRKRRSIRSAGLN